jgi:hypothetical protein
VRILAQALALLLACTSSVSGLPVRSVPSCSGITLAASYLAMTGREQAPGFRFILSNRTSREIKLAQPVPSSSHWYARSRGRWWWRASNGAGGSLVDALNQRGRVRVYPSQSIVVAKFLTVPPHQSREWTENAQENPVLEYKPGCALCSYPGESQYQVVFAYAYVSGSGGPHGLLACGLRSAPVPLPPKD